MILINLIARALCIVVVWISCCFCAALASNEVAVDTVNVERVANKRSNEKKIKNIFELAADQDAKQSGPMSDSISDPNCT